MYGAGDVGLKDVGRLRNLRLLPSDDLVEEPLRIVLAFGAVSMPSTYGQPQKMMGLFFAFLRERGAVKASKLDVDTFTTEELDIGHTSSHAHGSDLARDMGVMGAGRVAGRA